MFPKYFSVDKRLLIWTEVEEITVRNLTTGESHTSTRDKVWYCERTLKEGGSGLLVCPINSFKDVEVYANYFGERMGASFYERYKDILIGETKC